MALDVLRGAAQGITGRALKRVAGNIRSGLFPDARGGSAFSDLASLNTFSGKFKTKNLTFPMDVEAGVETGNHGHYIIFTAREQKNVNLSMFHQVLNLRTTEEMLLELNKKEEMHKQ